MTIKYFKTLASDLPPSNTSIICTGKKFCFTQNCQASYTVFMPYIKIYIYICKSTKMDHLFDGFMYFNLLTLLNIPVNI